MQLCQQHKEQRRRQGEPRSSPRSRVTTARPSTARGTAESIAATVASSPRQTGDCFCCSPTYGAAPGAEWNGDCRECWRAKPAYPPAAARKRPTASSCRCRSSEAFITRDFAGCSTGTGYSTASTSLIGRDNTVTDTTTMRRHPATAAGVNGAGCVRDFSVRQEGQRLQHNQYHQLQQEGRLSPQVPQEQGEGCTRRFPARGSRSGCRVTASAPPRSARQQEKEMLTSYCSPKSPAKVAHCTCTITCSNPCSRNSGSSSASNVVIAPTTCCSTGLSSYRNKTYRGASSSPARSILFNQTSACSSKPGVINNRVCSPSARSSARAFSSGSSAIVAASGGERARETAVEIIQRQTCSSTFYFSDYHKSSNAVTADDRNELEYYVYSTADDIVGRYCGTSYMWEKAATATFEEGQPQYSVREKPLNRFGGSAKVEQRPDAAEDGMSRKLSRNSSGSARAAPSGQTSERPAAGAVAHHRDSFAGSPPRRASPTAAADRAAGGFKYRRSGCGGVGSAPYTESRRTRSGNCCFNGQQSSTFSGDQPQENTGGGTSSSGYDNELEMYEHHSVGIWIHKTTCKTSHTARVTAPTVPVADPAAAAFHAAYSLDMYQECMQQDFYREEESDASGGAATGPLNCRSSTSSWFSNRPPLAAAGLEEGARADSLAASRLSSSSVVDMPTLGTQSAGKKGKKSSSSSSVVPSSYGSFGAAGSTNKELDTSVLHTVAARPADESEGETKHIIEVAAGREYVQKLSCQYDKTNMPISDEVPSSSAGDAAPAKANTRAHYYNFFSCLSPKVKLIASNSFGQGWSFDLPQKKPTKVSADAPTAAAPGVTAEPTSASGGPLEGKNIQPETETPQIQTTAPLAAAAAAATSARAEPAHAPSRTPTARTFPPSATSHSDSWNRVEADAESAYDNELEFYVFRTSQRLIEMGSSRTLLGEKGGERAVTLANSRDVCYQATLKQQEVRAITAVHTNSRTSGDSPRSGSASCSRGQRARIESNLQDCTAAEARGLAAATQGIQGSPACRTEGEETHCTARCVCPSSSSSHSVRNKQCDTGAAVSRRTVSAASGSLPHQNAAKGACKSSTGYTDVAKTRSRGSRRGHRCSEDKLCAASRVASPRVPREMTEEYPFAVIEPLEEDGATSEEDRYTEDPLQRQQQHRGQVKKTSAHVQPAARQGAVKECFGYRRELQESHHQQQRSNGLQQHAFRGQQRVPQQHLAPRQQTQTRMPLHMQGQQQRGMYQQKAQQLPTQVTERPVSAASKRQQMGRSPLAGRQDWDTTALDDFFEWKKYAGDVRKTRSVSCTSRTHQISGDGRPAAVSAPFDGRNHTYKGTGRGMPCATVENGEPLEAASLGFAGDEKSDSMREFTHRHSNNKSSCNSVHQQRQSRRSPERPVAIQQQQVNDVATCQEVLFFHQRKEQTHQCSVELQGTEQLRFLMSAPQQRKTRTAAEPELNTFGKLQLQDATGQQEETGPQWEATDIQDEGPQDGCVALYPMHTHHHLKAGKYGEKEPTRIGLSNSSAADMASFRESSRGGEDESSICPPTKSGGPQPSIEKSSKTVLQRDDGERDCISTDVKLTKPSASHQVDACKSCETQNYVTVAGSVYAKQTAPSKSSALPSSLTLSPASPSEEEVLRSTYEQAQRTSPSRCATQEQHEVVQQTDFYYASDVQRQNTSSARVDNSCGQRQQKQQQQHAREAQPPQDHQAQQQQQDQGRQRQRQHDAFLICHRRQQRPQQQQRLPDGKHSEKQAATKPSENDKENAGSSPKQNASPLLGGLLKCTCTVTPRSFGEVEAAGGSTGSDYSIKR